MVENSSLKTSGNSASGVASENLRRAEANASTSANGGDTSGFSASEEETSAGGLYTGTGKGEDKGTGKGKGKGFFKRKGPMALIIGLIFGGGGLMMGAQTLMPIAIEEMIIEKFNSIGVSTTIASDAWLDTQLNQGVQSGSDKQNLYAFSSYQVDSFKRQGLYVVNGEGVTAILYLKNGVYIPVVGSKLLGGDTSALVEKIKKAGDVTNVGAPVSAATALADLDFKTPYTTASKSWRGGNSGWFDKIMSNITEAKLSINRNRWARYAAGSIDSATEEFKKVAASSVKTKTSDFVVTDTRTIEPDDFNDDWKVGATYVDKDGEVLTVTDVKEIYSRDKDGNIIYKDGERVIDKYEVEGSNSNTSTNGVTESTITKVLNSKAMKAASVLAGGANYVCAAIEGLMSIYTVVSAYQSLQFLNLISGFLESVDKVKAGYGDSSAVHTYSNNLTTKANTVSVKSDGTASETSMGGVTTEVIASKTGMESQGMAWLFSQNSQINPNDTSVQNTNLETIMSNISGVTDKIDLTLDAFKKCGYVKVATSAFGLVTTILSFIPIFGQGIKAISITTETILTAITKGAITLFFYAMIPVVAKKVANSLIKDAATEWFGEDLGNAIVSGAGKYLGGNGTSGGQGPGDKDKVLAYLQERNTVIAEEAKYQRAIKSPFDMRSQYTFLGSLVYSMIPLAYSSSGVMPVLKDLSSLANSSIVALSPTASAIDSNSVMNSTGVCALLNGVGAVGDAFCNAYVITDTSTITTSPIAVADIVHRIGDNEIATNNKYVGISDSNFNKDGSIKEDSNLAKYITYCGQRTSQYGVKDAAIAERVTSSSKVGKIIDYVPVVNNIKGIKNGLKDVANMDWTTGRACVAADDNERWEQNKWYQRYAENERLLENMNPGYKSPVTAYLENYYKENPVDDSLEGQLARFSGMTKEDVSDTLALIEYYQFLAQYDASERYAFGTPVIEEKHDLKFDNENQIANNIYIVLVNDIEFADVRNRSFVV